LPFTGRRGPALLHQIDDLGMLVNQTHGFVIASFVERLNQNAPVHQLVQNTGEHAVGCSLAQTAGEIGC